MTTALGVYALLQQSNDPMNICARPSTCSPTLERSGSDVQLSRQRLPGCPRVSLDEDDAERYLELELTTPELDRYCHLNLLWLVATPSRRHVSSVTHQLVRGRQIVITEHSRLHCVWINDRIFVKPVPAWLLSSTFWNRYLDSREAAEYARHERVLKAAKGFLATYALLLRHESDFEMAKEEKMLPRNVDWDDLCTFFSLFESISDQALSARYSYGDLRLSRLNMLAPVANGKMNYHKVYGRYWSSLLLPCLGTYCLHARGKRV